MVIAVLVAIPTAAMSGSAVVMGAHPAASTVATADETGSINVSVNGNVSIGANVTVTATHNGSPVADANVSVNNESVGATDANGSIVVTVPDTDSFDIRVEKGDLEGEREFDLGDDEESADEGDDEEDDGKSGDDADDNPPGIAAYADTTKLGPDRTQPNNLAGKITVEDAHAANTTVEVVRSNATNYTIAITVTGGATNVTFYVQERAISSSQDVENVSAHLDGGSEVELHRDAVGNSPWIGFEVDHFSTRYVSFVADESAPESVFTAPVPRSGAAEPPTDLDGDGTYEDVDGDGAVTFADAIALAFTDTSALTPVQRTALDVDGDGDVDFVDAIELAFAA